MADSANNGAIGLARFAFHANDFVQRVAVGAVESIAAVFSHSFCMSYEQCDTLMKRTCWEMALGNHRSPGALMPPAALGCDALGAIINDKPAQLPCSRLRNWLLVWGDTNIPPKRG